MAMKGGVCTGPAAGPRDDKYHGGKTVSGGHVNKGHKAGKTSHFITAENAKAKANNPRAH